MGDYDSPSMGPLTHPTTISIIVHVLILAGVAVRVVMHRPTPGVALAWLLLVAVLPLLGLFLYLSLGERRIGQRRARRLETVRLDFEDLAKEYVRPDMIAVDWKAHPPESRALDQLGRRMVGVPTLTGNAMSLHSDTEATLRHIARDVDAAEHSVLMEFYIWNEGGAADEVVEALVRAAGRGVRCRVLVDALGARPWRRGEQPKRLRKAGVEVRAALRTGLIRGLFARNDLRLHRKIVAIDGRIGWTGSMNLVDPRHFKQESGVGQWIDAMVRVEGHVVLALASTLLSDWILESGESARGLVAEARLHDASAAGPADIQVVPSGPGETGDAILQMILALVYAARKELVLTTPYFVPDEAMLRALRGAAARGVRVHLVVPARNDSIMVRYASRSYYDELMDVGVNIQPYRGGLLHTKSITVDDEISMIGTVNLDMRSLWLNYEVSLFVYDRAFTRDLRALQQTYIEDCDTIDPVAWAERSTGIRFVENAFRLVSPLL